MPKVSVILCAYNAEAYLSAAVRSVLAQTFTDFEMIAVDDGAKDSTGKILDGFAAADARVKVIHQANTGQVQAARNGIAASTGELIARMDADDLCYPDRLAKQVAFLDANPGVVLLGGAYDLIDERGRLLTTLRQPGDDASLQDICLSGRCPICQPLAMFRRDAYVRTEGYRPAFPAAEDIDLWLRLGEVGQMACLPDVLLQYRQHGGSISETKQTLQLQQMRQVCEEAWGRRGVVGRYTIQDKAWRATDAASAFGQTIKYGWWAFNSGQRRTALAYGVRSVRLAPLSSRAWKLLACSAVKPMPTPNGRVA